MPYVKKSFDYGDIPLKSKWDDKCEIQNCNNEIEPISSYKRCFISVGNIMRDICTEHYKQYEEQKSILDFNDLDVDYVPMKEELKEFPDDVRRGGGF